MTALASDATFSKIGVSRAVALLVALIMLITCAACGEDKSDDSSMTEELLNSYMNSFCDYNIAGMNKCSMAKLDTYDDGEETVKACRSLAGRIEWQCENISIDGKSAIAQIRITLPDDFNGICSAALSDAVTSLDRNVEGNPEEILSAAVKKRAEKAETTDISAEVCMTKVNNKWYIVKSLGVNRVVSDIRTSAAAVFAAIGS